MLKGQNMGKPKNLKTPVSKETKEPQQDSQNRLLSHMPEGYFNHLNTSIVILIGK
jgi:hypothetical protein